jgi:hypothetical protein
MDCTHSSVLAASAASYIVWRLRNANHCRLRPHGLSLGQQLGRESLSFADALDLDRGRLNDLLDASDSCQKLRIVSGGERVSLTPALSKEIGTRERARENTDAREESAKRDDRSEVTGPWSLL